MHDKPPTARRDHIAARLAAGTAVVATALAGEFAVSEDAIRRDLRALAAEGRCRRVYGGALPMSPASGPIAERVGQAAGRKHALARRAAALLEPGEVVFLDSGSTNLALAAALPETLGLTVATNAVPIAAALLGRPGIRLLMVGGVVDPAVGGCVDAGAVLQLQQMRFDRCFLGACALSLAEGASAFDPADAAFKRMAASVSRRSAVLATTDKLETRAAYPVVPVAGLATIVVEHDAPPPLCDALSRAGAAVVAAARPA